MTVSKTMIYDLHVIYYETYARNICKCDRVSHVNHFAEFDLVFNMVFVINGLGS